MFAVNEFLDDKLTLALGQTAQRLATVL